MSVEAEVLWLRILVQFARESVAVESQHVSRS